MTVDELYQLVEEFFGCKIKMRGMNSEKKKYPAFYMIPSFWNAT